MSRQAFSAPLEQSGSGGGRWVRVPFDAREAFVTAQQPVPFALPEQDHREVANRPGLDQRERFEQCVERAEAAGADDERAR